MAPPAMQETWDWSWLGRSPGGWHGNPFQYSCLEDPMDRGAWWATAHGVIELDMTKATKHICTQNLGVNLDWELIFILLLTTYLILTSFPHDSVICLQFRRLGFDSWIGKIPWRREWQPTPVWLPGESQEESGSLQSIGCRVTHNWATNIFTVTLSRGEGGGVRHSWSRLMSANLPLVSSANAFPVFMGLFLSLSICIHRYDLSKVFPFLLS